MHRAAQTADCLLSENQYLAKQPTERRLAGSEEKDKWARAPAASEHRCERGFTPGAQPNSSQAMARPDLASIEATIE